MTRKFSSISVETTLASGISNSATSMTVATGTGSALLGGVTLSAGNVDQFTVALDPDTQNEEIVFITAVSSDTFTITRGQAGTSAITHSGGATVKHVLTSDDLTFFTTGVATANNAVPKSTVTTKGDLIAATSSATVTRVPAGTNGFALVADSTATAGVAYSAVVTPTGTQTLTNKDLSSGTNTFPSTFVTTTATQTLTNKTLTSPTITAPVVNLDINAQTGTTYTLALADNGKLITLSNSSAIAVTVPTNATAAFAVGAQVNIQQIGSGQVTISGASGVTINGTGTKLRTQWSAATLIKTATDTWTMVGDLTV